ncbi:MAG: hypothetical protein NZQ09_16820, partial [Chloroflexus sp.]|nr:hypothetical protein [Chloroflexus sp.]
ANDETGSNGDQVDKGLVAFEASNGHNMMLLAKRSDTSGIITSKLPNNKTWLLDLLIANASEGLRMGIASSSPLPICREWGEG